MKVILKNGDGLSLEEGAIKSSITSLLASLRIEKSSSISSTNLSKIFPLTCCLPTDLSCPLYRLKVIKDLPAQCLKRLAKVSVLFIAFIRIDLKFSELNFLNASKPPILLSELK